MSWRVSWFRRRRSSSSSNRTSSTVRGFRQSEGGAYDLKNGRPRRSGHGAARSDPLAHPLGAELAFELPGLAVRLQHFADPTERVGRDLGEHPADRRAVLVSPDLDDILAAPAADQLVTTPSKSGTRTSTSPSSRRAAFSTAPRRVASW